jgi:adenylate kinase family enzyme
LDIGSLRHEIARLRVRALAIDGPGGAGKSTLARQLADGWPEAVIVEMDDFYLPTADRVPGFAAHAGNYDVERLVSEVLERRRRSDRDVIGATTGTRIASASGSRCMQAP